MLPETLSAVAERALTGNRCLTVLTGAGISAESGIPTFRGPEGYWQIGSRNYKPEEIGTLAMFQRDPEEVWRWYLYRRTVCQKARANRGHQAVVALEKAFGDRFMLITQNVDGLHERAGSSPERTLHVHGSLDYIRCSEACTVEMHPFPEGIGAYGRETELSEADRALLICPRCGALARPHVLWFDESYDEAFYRFETALQVAARTGLLITVGTSGATNLPNHVLNLVLRSGGKVIDVNVTQNLFGRMATVNGGFALIGRSGDLLPDLAVALHSLA
jgi:NAD-dependent deacetylase